MSTEATVRPASDAEVNRLLAALLGEQQHLATPVVRASTAYDGVSKRSALTESTIENPKSKTFRDLIPLTAPGPGEQYAFEVDLDACSGCKSCVSACHSLNGLDDNESWRDVGLIVSADPRAPWQQTVTTACHHCAEPACLEGCPVVAYEKDSLTGIVRHLDDQCIGCSYCILKCPYDVPKFNARLGVVRKCDMCHQRLAVGEAPACVQACPTTAISIVKVPNGTAPPPAPVAAPEPIDSAHACGCGGSCGCKTPPRAKPPTDRRLADTSHFLPAAPDPEYTQPTTRYVSARGVPPHLRPADTGALRVQPAHWPLAAMLTLTQLAVGLLATAPLATLPLSPAVTPPPTDLLEQVNYWLTLAGSLPLPELAAYYATEIRAHASQFLGLALLFAGLGASTLHLGKPLRAWRFFLGLRTSWLSREILVFSAFAPLALATLLLPGSLALRLGLVTTGLIGIACSAMIYIDTRRRFWAAVPTSIRFFGTVAVAALATIQPAAAALILLAKLGAETLQARGSSVPARLQRGPLRTVFGLRLLLGATAIPLLAAGPLWPALAVFAVGELTERLLFFRAVDAPKMPGHPAAP